MCIYIYIYVYIFSVRVVATLSGIVLFPLLGGLEL